MSSALAFAKEIFPISLALATISYRSINAVFASPADSSSANWAKAIRGPRLTSFSNADNVALVKRRRKRSDTMPVKVSIAPAAVERPPTRSVLAAITVINGHLPSVSQVQPMRLPQHSGQTPPTDSTIMDSVIMKRSCETALEKRSIESQAAEPIATLSHKQEAARHCAHGSAPSCQNRLR